MWYWVCVQSRLSELQCSDCMTGTLFHSGTRVTCPFGGCGWLLSRGEVLLELRHRPGRVKMRARSKDGRSCKCLGSGSLYYRDSGVEMFSTVGVATWIYIGTDKTPWALKVGVWHKKFMPQKWSRRKQKKRQWPPAPCGRPTTWTKTTTWIKQVLQKWKKTVKKL